MNKEISFGGISNAPSDYAAPEGDFATCVDFINEDGSLRTMGMYRSAFNLAPSEVLVLRHTVGEKDNNFIIADNVLKAFQYQNNPEDDPETGSDSSGRHYCDFEMDISSYGEYKDATAIGNTIIFSFAEGSFYLLWKNDNYIPLGEIPPVIDITFGNAAKIDHSGSLGFWNAEVIYSADGLNISDEKSLLTQEIMGRVIKSIKEHLEKGNFVFPYFVRCAYRLFDGSLSYHSAPVLMTPTLDYAPFIPCYPVIHSQDSETTDRLIYRIEFVVAKMIAKINFSVPEEWRDIIRSVDIFVSEQIYPFSADGKIEHLTPISFENSGYLANTNLYRYGITPENLTGIFENQTYQGREEIPKWVDMDLSTENSVIVDCTHVVKLPQKDKSVFEAEIRDCANFYFLKSIPVEEIVVDKELFTTTDKDDLNGIQTRELMSDDYISLRPKKFSQLYAYNGRINGIGFQMKHFDGYNLKSMLPFCNYRNSNSTEFNCIEYYVRIDDPQKKYVKKISEDIIFEPTLMYYPNVNAKEIIAKCVVQGSGLIIYISYPLYQHKGLNGAVFFRKTFSSSTLPVDFVNDWVSYPSKLVTSQINNIFLFPPESINTIGNGTLMGIASPTKALSQGQFGQFPLYAFSTEGVWALEVASNGSYVNKQAISRDVCNNAKSITQIDGAIIFSTSSGLKLISGADVISISASLEQISQTLNGILQLDDFLSASEVQQFNAIPSMQWNIFLKDSAIAYDYSSNRLIVFNPYANYSYIYALKTKMWYISSKSYKYTINSYPNTLVVDTDNEVKNLSDSTIREQAVSEFPGMLITRPINLESPAIIKTVNELMLRGRFSNAKIVLWGSIDNINYIPISSGINMIAGIHGSGYKWFIIGIVVKLNSEEYLSGISIVWEQKYANKLR